MSWTKNYFNQIVLVIYLAILLEVFAYLASNFIPKLNLLFYIKKDVLSEVQYNDYMSRRDPVLGWPSRNNDFDVYGFKPRVESRFDEHCVSLYGDSYTYSAEVESEFSWSNIASKLLNCDVLNFGVGGYGTYQSFLRYTENMRYDHAKLVVLNHLSENIARVRNQYRNLLYPGQLSGFKPIATVKNSSIKHIPINKFENYDDYYAAVMNPGKDDFPHEAYLPSFGFSNFELRFPYSLSLAKALFYDYEVRAKLEHEPSYTFRYHIGSDVDLVFLIMKEFVAKVKENNQVPVITIIPTCRDLEYFSSRNIFPYYTLANRLKENNIEYFDFGNALKNRNDFAGFHGWFDSCSAHPNELGYKIMAEEFVKYIQLIN